MDGRIVSFRLQEVAFISFVFQAALSPQPHCYLCCWGNEEASLSLPRCSLWLFIFVSDERVTGLPPQCDSKSIGYSRINSMSYLVYSAFLFLFEILC